MKRKRHNYSVVKILRDWKADKANGYALRLATKHNVPVSVIHNVIYRHRKKKADADRKYRIKKNGIEIVQEVPKKTKRRKITVRKNVIRLDQSIFTNHVVTASPLTVSYNRTIII